MILMRWIARTAFLLLFASPLAAADQDAAQTQTLVIEVQSGDRPLRGASVLVGGRTEISNDEITSLKTHLRMFA